MAAYCNDTLLLAVIGIPSGSLPTAIDTEAERLVYIQQASATVDAMVGPRFTIGSESSVQKFPDITSSPATPVIIQEIAAQYATAYCMRASYGENTGGPSWRDLVADADERCREIAAGRAEVADSAGTVYGTRQRLRTQQDSAAVPTFTRGKYDIDGTLLDSEAGTLDGW